MSDSSPLQLHDPEYALLDANVIRGQLTTDILLTLAEHELLEPFWSQGVIDEMRRNRPAGVTEQRIDRRIGTMNEYFPGRAPVAIPQPEASGATWPGGVSPADHGR